MAGLAAPPCGVRRGRFRLVVADFAYEVVILPRTEEIEVLLLERRIG
jgi:hypothetical protein